MTYVEEKIYSKNTTVAFSHYIKNTSVYFLNNCKIID